jgi:hypothetical protein
MRLFFEFALFVCWISNLAPTDITEDLFKLGYWLLTYTSWLARRNRAHRANIYVSKVMRAVIRNVTDSLTVDRKSPISYLSSPAHLQYRFNVFLSILFTRLFVIKAAQKQQWLRDQEKPQWGSKFTWGVALERCILRNIYSRGGLYIVSTNGHRKWIIHLHTNVDGSSSPTTLTQSHRDLRTSHSSRQSRRQSAKFRVSNFNRIYIPFAPE